MSDLSRVGNKLIITRIFLRIIYTRFDKEFTLYVILYPQETLNFHRLFRGEEGEVSDTLLTLVMNHSGCKLFRIYYHLKVTNSMI